MQNKKEKLKDNKLSSFNISPRGIWETKKERNIDEALPKGITAENFIDLLYYKTEIFSFLDQGCGNFRISRGQKGKY